MAIMSWCASSRRLGMADVVALLGEEAKIKTFYREPDRVRLQRRIHDGAHRCTDLSILGKVVMAIRTFN